MTTREFSRKRSKKSVTRVKCAFSSGLAGAAAGRSISQTAVPISISGEVSRIISAGVSRRREGRHDRRSEAVSAEIGAPSNHDSI